MSVAIGYVPGAFGQGGRDPNFLRQLVQVGDTYGYDSLWLSDRSCTRALRIIPLSLNPATMPRLTILERGQGHGFTPFLLPTRSVGPRVALRHAACCRVSPRDSDTTDSDAHQAQEQTIQRAETL